MATLALSNAELFAELGRLLGISRTAADWDTVTAADVDRIVRSGRRRFFSAHNWKFLVNDLSITIAAPIETGTIEIVAGVVTLTGATWPATMSNYVLAPDSGGVYNHLTRDSDTQLTMEDTTVDVDALSDYALYQVLYDLPAAFGGWEGPVCVENYNDYRLNESRNLPEYVLRAFANRQTARTGRPELFSVVSTTDAETAIATFQLRIFPLPDQVYPLSTRYKISAGDTLDLAESAISCDPVFTECYKESVLAAGEVIAFGQPGSHTMRFQELLKEAVKQDNAIRGIRYGRPRRGSRQRNQYYDLLTGTVDMSSQEI